MFSVTALGNHSWMIEAGGSRLLIDPTLTHRYGPTPAQGLAIYPPREIDLAAMPPADAIFISHEHEGHFEIPSLARLDRRIPIWLSAHSSVAARAVLRELGFTVHLARPGLPIRIGALTLVPVPGDIRDMEADEWDNLGALVYDRDGHGSFFTTIDNFWRPEDLQLARAHVTRPGIWAVTNNDTDGEFDVSQPSEPPPLLQRRVEETCRLLQKMEEVWEPPELVLMVGGGFSFEGDHRWLNGTVFAFSPAEAAAVLARLNPGQPFRWPLPGERIRMEAGRVAGIDAAPWIRLLPRDQWPPRGSGAVRWLESFEPLTGRTELAPGEVEELEQELTMFAAHLYDRTPFHRLYSTSRARLQGREPTLAVVAREGDGAFVWAYEPQSCRFVAADDPDPAARYAVVFECWAPDLLALLRCELVNHALSAGHSRLWLAEGATDLFHPAQALLSYLTPTRWPDRFLRRYRAIAAQAADGIRSSGHELLLQHQEDRPGAGAHQRLEER